ncbi:MAG: exonuclease domain-containing protein, partial [Bacteroidota bacterium]
MAKKDQKFAIIDVETTGGRASRDKITEIGIVLHDGQQIIKTFESLLNPQTYIPQGIVQLTGITQEMVQDAPLFHEIAREIVEMTEGAIFVAHNVRFDYGFLRGEFSRLGYTYTRKQLCTVRMSRKAFPGLPSYSLENLIRHFGIKTDARHRALADAIATTDILERILSQEDNQKEVKLMVNLGIKESKLPKGITLEQIHNLPESCGVYYFHNAAGNVVYVGKSINIKKRIADHFADQTDKGR